MKELAVPVPVPVPVGDREDRGYARRDTRLTGISICLEDVDKLRFSAWFNLSIAK